jgi:hypothetical protein
MSLASLVQSQSAPLGDLVTLIWRLSQAIQAEQFALVPRMFPPDTEWKTATRQGTHLSTMWMLFWPNVVDSSRLVRPYSLFKDGM